MPVVKNVTVSSGAQASRKQYIIFILEYWVQGQGTIRMPTLVLILCSKTISHHVNYTIFEKFRSRLAVTFI